MVEVKEQPLEYYLDVNFMGVVLHIGKTKKICKGAVSTHYNLYTGFLAIYFRASNNIHIYQL